jgi:DNA invertase Pin-like site-specific DNA recombinase
LFAHSDGSDLVPRRGAELQVLVIARISTVHQDERSLDDQAALCQRHVRDRYPGPIRFTLIQGRGSGETLDRQDLADAEAAVASGAFDLVVVEDLGRICRRNRAIDFCELCEDTGTRLVAINDSIDTARDDWRLNAFFASFKHESGNKDTSRRIRRSLRHRFEQGGVVQTLPYGYVKPPGAKSDAEISKDPAAERVYEEVFRRLGGGASYAEVADWLNAEEVPTGPWMRSRRWDGPGLARTIRNPIVKGSRRRNERMSQRVNKTGRRKSVKAPPSERLLRPVPHLAFIDPARYDRLIADLDARHAACARGRKAGTPDTRAGVSKKRTVWPGQHVTCGVCGRPFYWGGHGQAGRLMCSGVREYRCWDAATFDGADAGRRLAKAILALAEALPDFDEAFRARVEAGTRARRSAREEALGRLNREAEAAERELCNLVDAVARIGFSAALQARLSEAEARKSHLEFERADLLRHPDEAPPLPPIAELKRLARESVGRLAFDDPEFARLMHRLVPRLAVYPYRPIDGGAVVLRAELTVNLAPLLGDAGDVLGGLIVHTTTVDLFDPPQRIAYRERVIELRGQGLTERAVAKRLGLTVTAAQRAMALHRQMQAAGVTDPYRRLLTPPDDDGKVRRHKHPRYRFQPFDGSPAGMPLDLT